jgi:hypothetical protein
MPGFYPNDPGAVIHPKSSLAIENHNRSKVRLVVYDSTYSLKGFRSVQQSILVSHSYPENPAFLGEFVFPFNHFGNHLGLAVVLVNDDFVMRPFNPGH